MYVPFFAQIFDMEEYKSYMALHMPLHSESFNEAPLEHRSMVGLSFRTDTEYPWDTPCWLLVISTTALSNIKNTLGRFHL